MKIKYKVIRNYPNSTFYTGQIVTPREGTNMYFSDGTQFYPSNYPEIFEKITIVEKKSTYTKQELIDMISIMNFETLKELLINCLKK